LKNRVVAIVVTIALALMVLTGCASTSSDPHTCPAAQSPLVQIPGGAGDLVQLAVPQPAGWQRSTKLDSAVIRYAMYNSALSDNGFTANAVVTLEAVPDGAGKAVEILAEQQDKLKKALGAKDIRVAAAAVCGFPAESIGYTAPARGRLPAHHATVLCAVADVGTATYLATLTLGSADPGNPVFQRASDAIITGFRITVIRR